MNRPRWPLWIALLLVLAGAGFRVAVALRPGLWGDEIFSLAMATGHSLEHPPAEADSTRGDFVEPRQPQPPSVFRRYAKQEKPPVGVERVIRAVLLSDTSPPLYYILLNWWTRAFGTGDAALRFFSVWWAILCLPVVWSLGRDLGRRKVAWTASVLFSFSPVAIYYSTEGRMYSLLWFVVSVFGWLTLRLSRRQSRFAIPLLWVLTGVGGLLIHYFFAFVWMACVAWLWIRGRPVRRPRLAALAGITLLAVVPWYLELPASLTRWRITGSWLNGPLNWPWAVARPLALAGSLLGGRTELGGLRGVNIVVAGLFLALAVWIARRGSTRRLFSGPRLLLWGWVAAACLGPFAFDILRHTTTTDVPRYALAGLPAAMLLAAVAMSQLPPGLHVAFLALVLGVWFPGSRDNLAEVPRPVWGQYRGIDRRLNAWAGPDDVVLVHSIPTGVIGVARYLRNDIRLASWIVPLHVRRVPDDLELLLAGCRRVAIVNAHFLEADNPAEQWLRANARLVRHDIFYRFTAEVVYFEPVGRDRFFPDASPRACDVAPPR